MFRLLLILILFLPKFGFCTLYSQYNWSDIIEKADHVLKVNVLSADIYTAKVTVLNSYKSEFDQDTIWITNSRLKESVGANFIVFLSDTIKNVRQDYWDYDYLQKWKLIDTATVLNAITNNQAYYTFRHAGAYQIKGDQIAVDLTNPYNSKTWCPLNEFEAFLEARYKSVTNVIPFHQNTVAKLKASHEPQDIKHYLKVLALSKNQLWDDCFEEVFKIQENELQLALIETLVLIKHEKSQALLVQLLKQDDYHINDRLILALVAAKNVQIAPEILSLLESKIIGSNDLTQAEIPIYSSEIQLLLYYFLNIEHPKAIPVIQQLLGAKNSHILNRSIDCLEFQSDKSYVPLLIERLQNDSLDIHSVCTFTINAEKYENTVLFADLRQQCFALPADPFSAIIAGIFLDENRAATEPLIIEQFKRLVADHSHLASFRYGQVFQKYAHLFTRYEITTIKPALYDGFKEYMGYGNDFRENPSLFTQKIQFKDSLNKRLKKQLKKVDYDHFEIHLRTTTESNFEAYLTIYYPNLPLTNNKDSTTTIMQQRQKLACDLTQLPQERIRVFTVDCEHYFEHDDFYAGLPSRASRVIDSFYGYLVGFGNEADLAFLKNIKAVKSKDFVNTIDWELESAIDQLEQRLKTK